MTRLARSLLVFVADALLARFFVAFFVAFFVTFFVGVRLVAMAPPR